MQTKKIKIKPLMNSNNNIKIYLNEIGCEDVKWIYLPQKNGRIIAFNSMKYRTFLD
jgi:hypothetical protein